MAAKTNEELEKAARAQEIGAKTAFAKAARVKVYVPKGADEHDTELYGCWNGIPVRYRRGDEVEMPDVVLQMFRDCGAL